MRPEEKQAKRRAREDPCAVPMTVGDVRFTLWLPSTPRAPLAANYRRLSAKGEIHEPVMLACLTRALQQASKSRFMDIGAHVAYYACYVSGLFGGREEVYAVESNPLYADAARESARLNGFIRMRVFQEALSDRVEPVNIDGLAVRHNFDSAGATIALTLDELCNREGIRPTIVKMDVHGAEGKIVLGMRSVLADVECLLLELHTLSYLREFSPGVTRTAILDALEESGLTLYHVAGHREPAPFRELLSGKGFYYRRLDPQSRGQTLFDGHDILVLGLRYGDIESLLGPSISPANA
jgi:FkbM family methyltransferase